MKKVYNIGACLSLSTLAIYIAGEKTEKENEASEARHQPSGQAIGDQNS